MSRFEEVLRDYERDIDSEENRKFYGAAVLNSIVEASPLLKANLEQAAASNAINRIALDRARIPGAGASYNSEQRCLDLNSRSFISTESMVFDLGHEVQHALSTRGGVPEYEDRLRQQIADIQQTDIRDGRLRPAPVDKPRDYTPAVRDYIEAIRAEEAQAHIGGFNALVSYLTRKNNGQPPSLQELYEALPGRMGDFIERHGSGQRAEYRLKPGLTIGRDGTVALSPDNIEAMKRHFADKFPNVLGDNGMLDYRHDALLYAWKVIQESENRILIHESGYRQRDSIRGVSPYVQVQGAYKIDFAAVGANPALMKFPPDGIVRMIDTYPEHAHLYRRGLDGRDPDGRGLDHQQIDSEADPINTAVRAPADASRLLRAQEPSMGERMLDRFRSWFGDDDAANRHAHQPMRAPELPRGPQTLLDDARRALQPFGAEPEFGDRIRFDNLAAQLAFSAKKAGLERIDKVVWNEDHSLMFAVQNGAAQEDAARRTSVVVARATELPARDSIAALLALSSPAPAPALPVVIEPSLVVDARRVLAEARDRRGLCEVNDPQSFENAAAYLALGARRQGLTQIDHLLLSKHGDLLIAVEGRDPSSPQSRHAAVPIENARHAPAQESTRQLWDLIRDSGRPNQDAAAPPPPPRPEADPPPTPQGDQGSNPAHGNGSGMKK